MNLEQCFQKETYILMEGAIGERLKREYHLEPNPIIALSSIVETKQGKVALKQLWEEYISIARSYNLPFLAATPTRRANQERIHLSKFDDSIIRDNVEFLMDIKAKSLISMYVAGLMGCKGDA